MRVLHVLSQTQVTGAETYAATVANAQIAAGHHVVIVSDTFQTPCNARFYTQPISKRSYLQRAKNVRFLRKLILREQIQVVHAHSRAASWVCTWAIRGTTAVYLSTIHGRQHIHTSVKLWDVYGSRLLPVCQAIAQHLIQEVGISSAKIHVVPNPVEVINNDFRPVFEPSLLIAGRMSGPKGEIIVNLLSEVVPNLLREFPNLTVTVAGGLVENISLKAKTIKQNLEMNFPKRIIFLGFVSNLKQQINNQQVMVASGRIAIEAMLLEKPVFAIGEAAAIGFVTSEKLSQALDTNFGDILSQKKEKTIDYQEIYHEISLFFRNPTIQNLPEITQRIQQHFNPTRIYQSIETHYQELIGKKIAPNWIPILMLHKVPLEPIQTKHRIFLTKDRFEKFIKQLKNGGFSTITFGEYQEYRNGSRPASAFPQKPIILTFDDAYLDNYTNAFPILTEYNCKATVFSLGNLQASTNFWDTQTGEPEAPLMSIDHRREMSRAGIEFGAHSMNHRKLTTLSLQELDYEINNSKKILEDTLGLPIISFAYPYGDANERVKRATEEAGYLFGLSTDSGGLSIEEDRFEIFRANIFPEESFFSFWKKTQPFYRLYYRWKRNK